MRVNNCFWVFIFSALTCIPLLHCSFRHEVIKNGWIEHESKIILSLNHEIVGYTYYSQLPGIHVLHSFYIFPEWRGQGYGKKLLSYTLSFLEKQGARRVYVQPGPFELVDGNLIEISNTQERMFQLNRLRNFYSHAGFKPVYAITSLFAGMLYTLLCIPEDAQYLMVFTF